MVGKVRGLMSRTQVAITSTTLCGGCCPSALGRRAASYRSPDPAQGKRNKLLRGAGLPKGSKVLVLQRHAKPSATPSSPPPGGDSESKEESESE
eukprot:105252-Heterocapsa_arctica.AAC.1